MEEVVVVVVMVGILGRWGEVGIPISEVGTGVG